MSKVIVGLFNNSDHAGKAVAELKDKDLAKDLSIAAKDESGQDSSFHEVEGDPMHGAKGGAISGAAVGGLGALALGASAVTLPGIGLMVAGPLATALVGLTGGAVTGGIVGALVDQGISKDVAEDYEVRIKEGQVFTSVSVSDDNATEVESILKTHGAKQTDVFES